MQYHSPKSHFVLFFLCTFFFSQPLYAITRCTLSLLEEDTRSATVQLAVDFSTGVQHIDVEEIRAAMTVIDDFEFFSGTEQTNGLPSGAVTSIRFRVRALFKAKEKSRKIKVRISPRVARDSQNKFVRACKALYVPIANPLFIDEETQNEATPPPPSEPKNIEPAPEAPTPDTTQACALSSNSSGLVVHPAVKGWGRCSMAGSGRTPGKAAIATQIFKIRNLLDSGPESLRECVEAKGPRTCIFEVSGTIWNSKILRVLNPFLTIAGQTAPDYGIHLRGASLSIEASHVLVQHLYIRPGDKTQPHCCSNESCSEKESLSCNQNPGDRDGLRIYASRGPIEHIVVDHVSIAWALDEGISIVPAAGNISHSTISNSIVAAGLDISIHPESNPKKEYGHSMGVLINGAKEVKNLSFHNNLLAHNADRNIRITTPISMEYGNNVIYNWGRGQGSGRLLELSNKRKSLHKIDIIGNSYIPGPDSFCPETRYRMSDCKRARGGVDTAAARQELHYILRIGKGTAAGMHKKNRYYIHDNFGPTRLQRNDREWQIADKRFFANWRTGKLRFPENAAPYPVASSGTLSLEDANVAAARVLGIAGARPWKRDSVDVGYIADVQKTTGGIINCVAADGSKRCAKNAGGWPPFKQHTKTLALPANPHEINPQTGYSQLEEWLFTQ